VRDCGLCTQRCATEALEIDRETMKVGFDYENVLRASSVCGLSGRAMNVSFT